MYSLFEINPVKFEAVPCTIGGSPSSGMTVTRYSVILVAPPARDGASQIILIKDSVTFLMTVDFGLSNSE